MAETPRLGLPLLAEAQDSPEVPVNLIAYEIDAILQGGVIQRDLATPPVGPAEGDAYIVPDSPTGAWVGHTDDIAAFQGGSWKFYTPRNGWTMHVQTEGIRVRFGIGSPSTWTPDTGAGIAIGVPGSPTQLLQDISRINFTNGTVIDNGDGSIDFTGSGGGGGGSVTVIGLDDSTTVPGVDTIQFASASVVDEGGGVVTVTPSGGGGGSGLENLTPDTHRYNASDQDDEFEGNVLDVTTLWTWVNQNTAQALLSGQGQLNFISDLTTGINLLAQPHTGPARYRCKLAGLVTTNFNLGGLAFRNSGNGRILCFDCIRVSSTMAGSYFTNATTYNSDFYGLGARSAYAWGDRAFCYYELEDDGTNIIGRASATGHDGTFEQLFSVTRAAFIGTPDQICLASSAQNTSVAAQIRFDWFRRYDP